MFSGKASLGFFVRQAKSGQGSNTFIGLPVGMAERYGVDFDEDDIYNLDEAPGHEYSAGSTASESVPKIIYTKLQWHTTRVAKINLDANNYTTVVATATPAVPVAGVAVRPQPVDERISVSKRFAKSHEIFFKDLAPGTAYKVTIQATNRATLASPILGPTCIMRTRESGSATPVFRIQANDNTSKKKVFIRLQVGNRLP